jgi:hypothetical protein
MQPFDFQEVDAQAILAGGGSGFVVAETGAGKTVIGARALQAMGVRTKLIIAPVGTHNRVWRRTIEELGTSQPILQINGSDSGKKHMDALEFERPGYYLMSPQLFTRWAPTHLRPDAILVDEIHQLGNRTGKGGMALRKMKAPHKIVMSGTIYRNEFVNAWNVSRFVYPEHNEPGDFADINYERWVDNWCATKYDHFAPGQRKVTGELEPGRFAQTVPVWQQHFKRRACCEFHPNGFLWDLPEPRVMREYVELGEDQKKAMRQVQRDYLAWLDDLPTGDRRALITKLPMIQQLRLDQMTLAMPSLQPLIKNGVVAMDDQGYPKYEVVFAPDATSPKLDRVLEIYRKVDEPMVVATKSKRFAQMAVPRLEKAGLRVFEWSSAASPRERDQALTDFEAGRYDVVFGVIEAIATGIDGLQEASGVLVTTDRSRDISMNTQLLGRQDRRGQRRKEGVLHYEILAEGTSDEDILDAQLEKRLLLNRSASRRVA